MRFAKSIMSPEDTSRVGKALAEAVIRQNPGTLLLYGDLGMGKTTLTRAVVEALPLGHLAEVSSPSFTICNIYCTKPEVHHFDLYRLDPGTPDEALLESLDNPAVLTIVEWADRIAPRDLPRDGLSCRITLPFSPQSLGKRTDLPAQACRNIEVTALGPLGERGVFALATLIPSV